MATFNYTVTAQGNSAFLINGNANPILTLQAGNTYNFIVNAPGHPFWIKTDRVIGDAARYDVGVTNNGTESGTVTIELPADKVPPKLFYQCGKHIVMGNALTKFEVPAESVANLIVDQLPDFIRADHPKFQLFMEAYYEWMNQPGNPWNEAKSLLKYSDIDTTVDDFLVHLEKEYVALIPKNFDGDLRLLIKNIKDFYITKGSPKSYEFLFNILFNETIEFYYPKRDILRASDGKWNSDTTIKITNPYGYDVFELSGQQIRQEEYYFDEGEQRYMYRDKATATVERAVQFFLGGELVTELFLSKVAGTFTPTTTKITTTDTNAFDALPETGKIYWFDALGNKHEYKIEPLLTDVLISDPGSGYDPDDVLPVIAANGDPGVNAIAQIKTVLSGPITGLTITVPGNNYKIGDILVFNNAGTSGAGAQGFVSGVNTATGTVPNCGEITEVRLVSGGFGYKKLPQISIQIVDPESQRVGLNVPTVATITANGQNIGGIKDMQIINFGALYYEDPVIDFTTQGNGDASGSSVRGGLARYPGSFSNDDGWISAAKYLQDNKFYQEFSYVIRTGLSINAYRDTIKTLVHPAGMELFGEVFISSKVETGLYNNGVADVNDTVLNGGIEVPRYIKLLQVFQSEFTQPYKDVIIDSVNGGAKALAENKHFHDVDITDRLGKDTKALAASIGQFIRVNLEWVDVYGDTQTENRLLTITNYQEGVSLTGQLSDGANVTLNWAYTEMTDATTEPSILWEDFSGTYDRAFDDQDGTYTATVTVTGRYRHEKVGLLPVQKFPAQVVGNVFVSFAPDQWNGVNDPGTLNLQPIRKVHLTVPRIRGAFLGTEIAINPVLPTKTSYIFLDIINRYLVQDGLTHNVTHGEGDLNEGDIQLRGFDTYAKHLPHREPWGFQIGNLTGGDRLISDIEDHYIYKKYAGFTGTRPVNIGHITHTHVDKLETGVTLTGTNTISKQIAIELNVQNDVTHTVILQPYAGNIRPINDVLFTGYKYFTGKIGEYLDREIVDYFGADIVPNRPVGANGGPSYGQVALQTFIDLGLNIQDFLDHEFGISEYFVYGANFQRTVEIDYDPLLVNRQITDANVVIVPIKVSVSAVNSEIQARQDGKTIPVSVPKLIDNAFYSGNTNFGLQINMLDTTIEEIENGVIRNYFTTVNPQPTVFYTRDNTDTITGTY